MKSKLLTLLVSVGIPMMSFAQEELVLDFESDIDSLMFLSHNIDGFPFPPTASYSDNEEGNMAERMGEAEALERHLTVTGLIKIDGEVVGIGTEHELVGEPGGARSAWLFILNHPEWKGTFAVEQVEGGGDNGAFRQEVLANPDRDWPDEFQYLYKLLLMPELRQLLKAWKDFKVPNLLNTMLPILQI